MGGCLSSTHHQQKNIPRTNQYYPPQPVQTIQPTQQALNYNQYQQYTIDNPAQPRQVDLDGDIPRILKLDSARPIKTQKFP